jgi:hypothetical protein
MIWKSVKKQTLERIDPAFAGMDSVRQRAPLELSLDYTPFTASQSILPLGDFPSAAQPMYRIFSFQRENQ